MDGFSVAAEAKELKLFRLMRDAPQEKALIKQLKQEVKEQADNDVFGVGHRKARDGTPIEQGLGSFENPTEQSIQAYIKNQTERRTKVEDGFEENLKKMRARFAEVQAQRRSAKKDGDSND